MALKEAVAAGGPAAGQSVKDLTKSIFETLGQFRDVKVPGTNRESQVLFSAEINRLEQQLESKAALIFR